VDTRTDSGRGDSGRRRALQTKGEALKRMINDVYDRREAPPSG
jgi:hypothetical protein